MRWFVPIRVQQGTGLAERAPRARREETRLRRDVQAAHRVVKQRGNGVAVVNRASVAASALTGVHPLHKASSDRNGHAAFVAPSPAPVFSP